LSTLRRSTAPVLHRITAYGECRTRESIRRCCRYRHAGYFSYAPMPRFAAASSRMRCLAFAARAACFAFFFPAAVAAFQCQRKTSHHGYAGAARGSATVRSRPPRVRRRESRPMLFAPSPPVQGFTLFALIGCHVGRAFAAYSSATQSYAARSVEI